jgi:hypothetical protein
MREWMGDRRVAAALVVAALVSVGYRFLKPGGGPPPVSAPPPALSPAVPNTSAAAAFPPPSLADGSAASEPLRERWSGPAWDWARNPFLLPASDRRAEAPRTEAGLPPEEGTLPELRGTVVCGNARLAIFGKRLVSVGGRVGEWTLSDVEPYRVALRRGRETRVLELYKQ